MTVKSVVVAGGSGILGTSRQLEQLFSADQDIAKTIDLILMIKINYANNY